MVLGLVYRGKFGTLGLSRRNSLMDKPLEFTSLNDLVQVRTIHLEVVRICVLRTKGWDDFKTKACHKCSNLHKSKRITNLFDYFYNA